MRLQIRVGRQLSISPPWPDESARIVFDRHSGDYWLLTAEAGAQLAALLESTQEFTPGETLDELLRAGLVQAAD
ncbi:hypothetical protein J7U46_15645 [Pelomonas sp. V22]|uniref:hypothetical protein n=1 Tax=Pelomonas sp. V22 TaxID=2822139 RepID=UPI0024A93529|nr:hypothetical protein [Pelomonas sp. V22]MDI4634493.1 hypothetical protein [Pelomonas sp. V22]